MANRTRGGFEPYPIGTAANVLTSYRKNAATVTTTNVTNNPDYGSFGNICTDVVTPRWRERIQRGDIINNPFSIIERHIQVNPLNGLRQENTAKNYNALANGAEYRLLSYWANLKVDLGSSLFPPLPEAYDFSLREQEVINKAFVKSHQNDVLGLVDLAELGKTWELLVENLGRIERLIRGDVRMLWKIKQWKQTARSKKKATKDGRLSFRYYPKTAMGKLGDVSNYYLEYTYGIIPLMSTVEGLLKQIVEITKPTRLTFRAQDLKDLSYKSSQVYQSTQLGQTKDYVKYTISREINWSVRAGVMTEFKPSLSDRLGLNLHSVPGAVYELIPFSFVLDWIWDLNSAIVALTPHPGYRALASWSTVEKLEQVVYTVDYLAATFENTSTIYQMYPGQFSAIETRRYKQRTPGVSPGIPNAKLNFSHFTHLSNGAALIASSMKRSALARI